MNTLTKLEIAGTPVRTDREGRFCLNDLHAAAGGEKKHGPAYWLAVDQTKDLIAELETTGIPVVTKEGRGGGTYVCKELVYAYAMWISPAFHLKVIRAYDALATGDTEKAKAIAKSGLAEFRKARALELSARTADMICGRFPHLSTEARQVIFAYCVNPVAGADVVPLPVLERKFYTAEQVGQELGVSANRIGRLANEHGLKTTEYGMFVLDKSRFSDKQVEAFRYNAAGIERLRELLKQAEPEAEAN